MHGMDELQGRRGFLKQAAGLAAGVGLAAAGCSEQHPAGGDSLRVVAGPKPKSIDPARPLRIGLIGCGARMQYSIPLLFKNPNLQIVAISETDPANIDHTVRILSEQGNERPEVYRGPDDWRDKLLARDDVDAVMLATPCYLHTPMYLACFAAGKHFYGEKPMAITRAEADAMVAAQERNPDVIAQIGFQRRGTPLYQTGVKMIHDGQVGRILDCRAAWNNGMGPLGRPEEGARVWLGRRALSGDWMLEQACHTWDVLNWIAGALPVAVTGIGHRDVFKDIDAQRDVTDMYYAHLEYPDFFVDFEHSWIAPPNDEMRFFGIFEKVAGRRGGMVLNEGRFFPREAGGDVQQYGSPIGDPLWTEQSLGCFVRSLRERSAVVCGVHEGRQATLTGLLVRQAVDEHRRITMADYL